MPITGLDQGQSPVRPLTGLHPIDYPGITSYKAAVDASFTRTGVNRQSTCSNLPVGFLNINEHSKRH